MRRRPSTVILLLAAAVLTAMAVVAAAEAIGAITSNSSSRRGGDLASNPALDPGTPVARPAPDFTLTDQFGRRISLHSYQGKVVILAFIDSQCTTVCPLTTTAMLDAKRLLGAVGSRVQLLGVDANPTATRVADVRAYSQAHGMINEWHFLTAPLPRLKRLWQAYGIESELVRGLIDHTPALYVIDTRGRERKVYMTQQAYAPVRQLGQLLAQEAAGLLPGHPRLRSKLSL